MYFRFALAMDLHSMDFAHHHLVSRPPPRHMPAELGCGLLIVISSTFLPYPVNYSGHY
jgi:hypothetical protein